MAAFSATDAAFEGFRLARERPQAILLWGLVLLVFAVISGVLLVLMAGPAFAEMIEASQAATPESDPAEMLAQMGAIGPAYTLLLLLSLVLYAVLYAAVYRAVLRPADPALGFLRFGADELRQGIALVVVFLLLMVGYIGVVLLMAILVASGAAIGDVVGGAIAVIGVVLGLGVLLWLAVKLSLLCPLTFDTGKLDLGAAWRLTKGRFWPLLGAYLLAGVLTLVVYLLALVIFLAIGAVLGGGLAEVGTVVMSPNTRTLGDYFSPLMLLYLVFTAFLGAFTLAITIGATASAYRQLSPRSEVDVFA